VISSRRIISALALSAGLLISAFAVIPATSAAAAPASAPASAHSALTVVPNMTAPPTGTVPSPPYGELSTDLAYCDQGNHWRVWGVGIMNSWYQETGIWNNRWYQEYWLVYSYFGGAMDVGYSYRWC
jgi:hypothetical protein